MTDLSRTYKQIAEEFIAGQLINPDLTPEYKEALTGGIEMFAKHLDSFTTLDMHMQIIAMTKSAQINQEIFDVFWDTFDRKKIAKIYREILGKHKKHAKEINSLQEKAEGEKEAQKD